MEKQENHFHFPKNGNTSLPDLVLATTVVI